VIHVNAKYIKGPHTVVRCKYHSTGYNCLRLEPEGDPYDYVIVSSCIDHPLKGDEVAIKNYSENEGILDELIKAGFVSEPVRYFQLAYAQFPICNILKVDRSE